MFRRSVFVVGLMVLGASVVVPAAQPAQAATFNVTSTSCTGPGSISEAVAAANADPGPDIIEFSPGLVVSVVGGNCGDTRRWIADVTESVTIEGNGARLVGGISWVTTGGLITPLDKCPSAPDIITAASPGFLAVGFGTTVADNIDVTVRNLSIESLNDIASFDSDNGSLEFDGLTAKRILSHRFSCAAPAIEMRGTGSDLTLRNNDWNQVLNWGVQLDPPLLTNQAIQAADGGDLLIEDSTFGTIGEGGFIQWDGNRVDIVTTRMVDAGGIQTFGSMTTNIVNSMWATYSDGGVENRIINTASGPMNLIASTIKIGAPNCNPECTATGADGVVRQWPGGGTVNLIQSAIGTAVPASTGRLLGNAGLTESGGFSADVNSWVQPVADQDATALRTLTGQAGLLTDPAGLPATFALGPEYVSPLLGPPAQLIDKIPDSTCTTTTTGANALLNPVDGSCITTDVFGNSRWDTGNGARNIGAVQLTLAPHLAVTGTGDGTVDLGWNRPPDGTGDSVTGYAVRFRPAGSTGAFTEVPITGPDTLAATVSGLVNGTEYEFEVAAVRATAGAGPASNRVTATPLGAVGSPEVFVDRAGSGAQVSWTEPAAGGHPGPLRYTLVYRPVGSTNWLAGPALISARTSSLPGLDPDQAYEFGVHATALDGVTGPLGSVSAPAVPSSSSTVPSSTVPPTSQPAPPTSQPAPPTSQPAPTTLAPILPETGRGTTTTSIVAILFLLGGAAMIALARRRLAP